MQKFTNYTVGVHIRRTDNINSIRESPTELFIQRMKKEIESESDVRFYVASDSTEEKKEAYKHFRRSNNNGLETHFTIYPRRDRGCFSGTILLITYTKKIFGSHRSSYSETAAEIGKISHEKIKSKL